MAGGRHRFAHTELLLEPSLKARLEARARAEGCSVGELARDVLSVALEAREAGPGTVVKSRPDRLAELAEENLNELRMLAMLIGAVGRPRPRQRAAPRPLGHTRRGLRRRRRRTLRRAPRGRGRG